MKTEKHTLESFLAKIESLKKTGGVDLAVGEDLSLAVMNLISLEEHFYFTAMKTGKDDYLDTSLDVRNMRKELLADLMPHHEGETWCASKHLLSAAMRLVEVGNKLHSEGKKIKAKEMFQKAYSLYSIFWALKLNLATVSGRGSAGDTSEVRLENLVSKLADCCKE